MSTELLLPQETWHLPAGVSLLGSVFTPLLFTFTKAGFPASLGSSQTILRHDCNFLGSSWNLSNYTRGIITCTHTHVPKSLLGQTGIWSDPCVKDSSLLIPTQTVPHSVFIGSQQQLPPGPLLTRCPLTGSQSRMWCFPHRT